MKFIKIPVPDWHDGRTMHVFYGREYYAHQKPDGPLFIKTDRCVRCGKCCRNPGPAFPAYTPEGEDFEICAHADQEASTYECRDPGVPFGCLREDSHRRNHPDCPITFEEAG